MQYIKPTEQATSELLGMLYGGEVETKIADDVGTQGYSATFINPENELVAACVCDPAMVILSGAALSMLPPGRAKEMLKDQEFSKSVVENFHEVMNICTRLLVSNSTPHLKLQAVGPTTEMAASVDAVRGAASSVSFELEIPKYGLGKIQFIVH